MGGTPDFAAVRSATMPVGVVLRRAPGVTHWAAESWTLAAVLPFARPAAWRLLREAGGTAEWHAATLPLEVHRADAEAYVQGLSARVPSLWVVMRGTPRPQPVIVTVSPFEAQDYEDNGEDRVEKIAMPEGMAAWVRDFAAAHHEVERFKKRRRKDFAEPVQDGIGDSRVRQGADVFRSPRSLRSAS